MDVGLTGKVAIVSGASRGIGRACAEELAREGADVVLVARDGRALDDVGRSIAALGRRSVSHICDLREPSSATATVDRAIAAFGRIDVLVHSAGATKRGDFFSLTDADFDDGFALKFMGAVRLTREAWPHLAKSNGTVVNIIGMGGRDASPDFTVGGPVNAALMNFTKAMSIRGNAEGVRVVGINPGLIDTDRFQRRVATYAAGNDCSVEEAHRALLAERGLPRAGKPEEIGRLVCFLAGSPGSYMNGSIVAIDGGEFHGV